MIFRTARNALWLARMIQTKPNDKVVSLAEVRAKLPRTLSEARQRSDASCGDQVQGKKALCNPCYEREGTVRHHPFIVFFARCALIGGVAFLVLLTGCTSVQVAPQADDVFKISHTEVNQPGGDGLGWARAAQSLLSDAAIQACPDGYSKLSEHVAGGDLHTTTWVIKCEQ